MLSHDTLQHAPPENFYAEILCRVCFTLRTGKKRQQSYFLQGQICYDELKNMRFILFVNNVSIR